MNGSIRDEIQQLYRNGSVLIRLIIVNAAVFLAANLLRLFFFLFQLNGAETFILDWFASTSSLGDLLFRPWTIVTYMFLHLSFWHLFFNMLILYFASTIFLQFLGEKRLVSTYFLGGFAGLLLYILSYNIFPVFSELTSVHILGASAAVMAIFVGIATYRPDLPVNLFFIGSIKLKYIAIFYVVLDLISIRSGVNSGGHIAHIGGALFGYLAMNRLKSGQDILMPFHRFLLAIPEAFNFSSSTSKSKMKVKYKKNVRHMSDEQYNKYKAEKEKEIDEILDKISKSGYESLTKKEKETLFRASNKD